MSNHKLLPFEQSSISKIASSVDPGRNSVDFLFSYKNT